MWLRRATRRPLETVKRTALADNIVIVTVKKTDPHSIRPFATFTVIPMSRFVHRFRDFVTEAAALQRHGQLARDLIKVREDAVSMETGFARRGRAEKQQNLRDVDDA